MRVVPLHESNDTPNRAGSPTIGKYRLVETIGQGAMGVVYKARDPEIGRDVAIKVLRSMQSAHPQDAADAFKRFRLEARSAGNLRHPNIIAIFEAHQESDRPYIVMEYIRGEGLDQILTRERRLQPARALAIFRQIAAGLDYAHSKGIVHRDIKPSNVLIEGEDKVYILDFGVASMSKRIAGAIPLPAHDPDIIVGTPAYMSPEQVRNEELDGRSDLFSFAALAFECLTGKIPFLGETATGLMRNIVAGKRRALGSVAPELPVELEFAFDRAFSIPREKRFDTADEFVNSLAQAFGMSDTRNPSNPPDDSPISLRRRDSAKAHQSTEAPLAGEPVTPVKTESPRNDPPPRSSREDACSPRQNTGPRPLKPGTIFEGGTLPVMAPQRSEEPRKGLRRMPKIHPEKALLLVVVGLITPLTFLITYLLLSENQSGAPNLQSSVLEIAAPAELESELIVPRVEAAPDSLAVSELSNRQLLGVIMGTTASEQRVLDALTLAADRRIAEFVDASVATLKHPSAGIRFATIKLLGNTADRRIVPHLVVMLEDSDEQVRIATARALAELGDRRALGFLSARYFAEKSKEAQSALKRSIEQLSGLPLTDANLINHIKAQSPRTTPQE